MYKNQLKKAQPIIQKLYVCVAYKEDQNLTMQALYIVKDTTIGPGEDYYQQWGPTPYIEILFDGKYVERITSISRYQP